MNGVIELSETGKIVHKFWFEIPKHFENIQLNEFVVMPNHIHGIIIILYDFCRGEVSSPIFKADEIKRNDGEIL